jgi:hypothetical protein
VTDAEAQTNTRTGRASDDIDDLGVEIAKAVTEIAGLRAREQRHRLNAEGSGGNSLVKSARGQAKYQLAMASEKREQAEARLHALQLRQQRAENEVMRNADDGFPAAMTPPHAGWRLVAFRSMQLGSRHVSRGAEITTNELAQCLNAPSLLAGGHVRWVPPQAAVAPKRPAPQLATTPMAQASDPIGELIAAVKQDRAQLGLRAKDALDLRRHMDLKERAIKAYGELSRVVRTGAFGGGAQQQKTGIGTLRRVTDDFEDYICREVEKTEEAA